MNVMDSSTKNKIFSTINLIPKKYTEQDNLNAFTRMKKLYNDYLTIDDINLLDKYLGERDNLLKTHNGKYVFVSKDSIIKLNTIGKKNIFELEQILKLETEYKPMFGIFFEVGYEGVPNTIHHRESNEFDYRRESNESLRFDIASS